MFHPIAKPQEPASERRLGFVIATLLGSGATFGATAAVAAPAAVTSCTDDGGFDTLRHAVLTSNAGDTIDLGTAGCGTITLSAAIPINFAPLTIIGPGADKLTIDANGVDRVFVNNTTSALTLTDLTISHGAHQTTGDAFGGCVYSKGTVTLQRAVVSHCSATGKANVKGGGVFSAMDVQGYGSTISDSHAFADAGSLLTAGGAIYAQGTITLHDSIVSGNTAMTTSGHAYGGAMMAAQITVKYSTLSGNTASGNGSGNAVGGALRSSTLAAVINSTLDHNSADIGGAISAIGAGGTLGIVQSTISSNTANTGIGQAISANVNTEIDNSTIAFNTGGVYSTGVWIANASAVTVTLNSTIIANNTALDIDVFNPMQIGGGSNLVRLAGNGAKLPGGTVILDPKLGPLAYNGGTMRTHAIDATSPAIEAGSNPDNFTVDQRGPTYRRVVNTIDIGAFEFDGDHIFGCGFESH